MKSNALKVLSVAMLIGAAAAYVAASTAEQIAGDIVYTDDDDYPAMCVGRELDPYGVPVIARISTSGSMPRITITSCTLIFHGGFEEVP